VTKVVLFLHQEDDFFIACKTQSMFNLLCDTLYSQWHAPMTQHGLMWHFNGVDVVQAENHITLLVETGSFIIRQTLISDFSSRLLEGGV
jgi:hypothetical protein